MWNIWAYFVKKHCFHFSGTPSTNDKILILIFSRIWHRYFWRLFLWLFTLHNPIVLCLNKFSRNYCKFKVKVPCYIGLFMRYWYGSPEKSQSYQASIQCWVIICPPAERHFNGVLEIACWLADGCPFIAVFGSSFAHQLKKEKKSYQIWTPSDKKLSGSMHGIQQIAIALCWICLKFYWSKPQIQDSSDRFRIWN